MTTRLSDKLKAAIDQMRAVHEQEAQTTREFIARAIDHCDRMKDALDQMAADDPRAAAIELLRAEGWGLIPPRK